MLLDPLSDKLLSAALSITLFALGKFPLYFMILILGRDAIISLGALYAIRKKHLITLPLILGKINTFILWIVLALYPLEIFLRESPANFFPGGFDSTRVPREVYLCLRIHDPSRLLRPDLL
jgi:phosphatidylglycerophosphate synthase